MFGCLGWCCGQTGVQRGLIDYVISGHRTATHRRSCFRASALKHHLLALLYNIFVLASTTRSPRFIQVVHGGVQEKALCLGVDRRQILLQPQFHFILRLQLLDGEFVQMRLCQSRSSIHFLCACLHQFYSFI